MRVNVSPVQLVTDGFVDSVAGIMSEFDLDRGSVCLEITESVVVQDIETTRITLAGLKPPVCRSAIDDFGTGYSALSQLKSLPVDTLKIDKGSFGSSALEPRRSRDRAGDHRARGGLRIWSWSPRAWRPRPRR